MIAKRVQQSLTAGVVVNKNVAFLALDQGQDVEFPTHCASSPERPNRHGGRIPRIQGGYRPRQGRALVKGTPRGATLEEPAGLTRFRCLSGTADAIRPGRAGRVGRSFRGKRKAPRTPCQSPT